MTSDEQDLLIQSLKDTSLEFSQAELLDKIDSKYTDPKHGHFKEWKEVICSLPKITPSIIDFNQTAPMIGKKEDCDHKLKILLENKLKQLSPWRKGPFNIFGIYLDSEWRSDWKWSRIQAHIELENKLVLDIGCGNGYYALRMQALGAKLVMGVDPSWLFVFQFYAIQKYFLKEQQRVFVLPFSVQEIANTFKNFDTIFSMGVLYHRQEPQQHLTQIYALLVSGGQFVLETLIIEDENADVLIPNERYANMKNVWLIPSLKLLETWLKQVGFINIRLVDKTRTTVEEQRQTEWMKGFSLTQALDANDPTLTIEGYPSPLRAIVIADKP